MDCTINKDLFFLKLLMFLWWGDFIMLVPMLLVHMKQIGFSLKQIATIYTCLPIFQFSSQPVLGLLADKTGSYKILSLIYFVIYAISTTAVFFLPSVQGPYEIVNITDLNLTGTYKYDQLLREYYGNASLDDSTISAYHGNATDLAENSEAEALTFWLYFLLQIFITLTSQSIFTLMESSSLVMVAERNAEYGKQRFWAIVGSGLLPLLGGYLSTATSYEPGMINFQPLYCLSNVVLILVAILSMKLNLKLVPPVKNLFRSLKLLAKSRENIVFIVVLLALGTLWGFSENFLLIYMRILGSPAHLLSLTFTVSTVSGLPVLFTADWIIRKMGHVPILILCFGVYMVRFIGYSLVNTAELCLIFEALESVTYHLFWVAAVTYSILLSPPELMATVQGTIGSMHYAVGSGLGSLFGGLLIADYGYRSSYHIMAGCSLAAGVCYGIYYLMDKRDMFRSCSSAPKKTASPKHEPIPMNSVT